MSAPIATHPEAPSNFGAFLRQRRLELNLRDFELAALCRLSPATIFKFEAGQSTNPKAITLQRLAAGLAVDPTELFTRVLRQT